MVIFGREGPQEIVSRHPVHGGWILYSQGTLWTSWLIPPRAEEDPLLRDDVLHLLPSDLERHF